jgi:acyl carrier protein
VREIIRELLDVDMSDAQLTDDVDISQEGLGFDSVRMFELLMACEDAFRVQLPADALLSEPLTIGRLTAAIVRQLPSD